MERVSFGLHAVRGSSLWEGENYFERPCSLLMPADGIYRHHGVNPLFALTDASSVHRICEAPVPGCAALSFYPHGISEGNRRCREL